MREEANDWKIDGWIGLIIVVIVTQKVGWNQKKKKAIKKFGQVSIELMVKIDWNLFKIQREIGCKLVGELMQSSVKIWLRIWPKLVWNFGLKSTSGNWLGNSNEFLQKPPKNWHEIDCKIYQKLGTPKIGVVSVIKSCQNWLQIDG